MATIEHMEVHVCGKCGCESWMLRTFLNDKRKTRENFYCPNGHCRAFVKSTEEILQEKLNAANLSIAANNSQLEKLKTGECPFCCKTVRDLSGHLRRNHA